jgi:haloacetate dehalogenase
VTIELFPGFRAARIAIADATINAVIGGNGPPLLLLHGWPQNLNEWHHIAPQLAKHFTVVATDLRGYGDSSKPADGENHLGYSKRAMAADQVAVMQQLGFTRFAVVGHDRGGRVAHRMALDHAEHITRMAIIDIVPTLTVYSTVTKSLATAYYHWFFLIQPAPVPETLLAGQGDFFLRNVFRGLNERALSKEVFANYAHCFNDPATLHAMCEDYRAAASIDLEHDRVDLDKKITCPLLVLWGERGAMHNMYDVLATWRERANDVRGKALPGGHWLPEEIPSVVQDELLTFLLSTDMTLLHDINLTTDPLARQYLKNETVTVQFAKQAGEVASREGVNRYAVGDALITGSTGDKWSVSRARFDAKYAPLPPLSHGHDGVYRNIPTPVLAKQMNAPFAVERAAGSDVIRGNAGDWLMQYAPGDYGIVENAKFVRVYRLAQ